MRQTLPSQTALSRRTLLGAGAAALASAALPRISLAHPRPAPPTPPRDLAVILLLLRGGADGLSLCVPHADPAYTALRPDIAVPPPGSRDGALPLNPFYSLPPAMAPLADPFRLGRLAIVHAVGLPGASRIHPTAQRQSDLACLETDSAEDAWLTRFIGPGGRAAAYARTTPTALRGIDPGSLLLLADRPAPRAGLRARLEHAAGLVSRDASLRAVVLEHSGYDAHRDADPSSGPLAATLAELAESLRAFHDRALGPAGSRPVTLIALSEFGRTIGQNADRGTDHGDAGAVLILGNALPFSGVRARWPGLARRPWSAGLPPTTDLRDLLARVTL